MCGGRGLVGFLWDSKTRCFGNQGWVGDRLTGGLVGGIWWVAFSIFVPVGCPLRLVLCLYLLRGYLTMWVAILKTEPSLRQPYGQKM